MASGPGMGHFPPSRPGLEIPAQHPEAGGCPFTFIPPTPLPLPGREWSRADPPAPLPVGRECLDSNGLSLPWLGLPKGWRLFSPKVRNRDSPKPFVLKLLKTPRQTSSWGPDPQRCGEAPVLPPCWCGSFPQGSTSVCWLLVHKWGRFPVCLHRHAHTGGRGLGGGRSIPQCLSQCTHL